MNINKESIVKFLESKNKICSSETLNERTILKESLCDREIEQLNNKLMLKKELERKNQEPSQKLKDKIEEHKFIIDKLESEIKTIKLLFLQSIDISNVAISELRKINPKKANDIENSISLKNHNINKTRNKT
ncbi:hypothetical protein [Vibrio cholerae]|uniref:hypothetical protein n=1 Tax=Vibrio cholerae TaxID=666 RepID=UPI00201AB754|nr:hypothetical protein [Vibrio cholerae]ELK6278012.1 hypothetical protein [Vibrio cholerae]MCL5754204.1 hypothetical protein [Vibrio cholerae]